MERLDLSEGLSPMHSIAAKPLSNLHRSRDSSASSPPPDTRHDCRSHKRQYDAYWTCLTGRARRLFGHRFFFRFRRNLLLCLLWRLNPRQPDIVYPQRPCIGFFGHKVEFQPGDVLWIDIGREARISPVRPDKIRPREGGFSPRFDAAFSRLEIDLIRAGIVRISRIDGECDRLPCGIGSIPQIEAA